MHLYKESRDLVISFVKFITHTSHVIFQGQGCCSKYSVTYHYVSPSEQYLIEHLLYKTDVYRGPKGDNSGQENNNKNRGIPMFDPKVVEPDD